MMAIADDMKQLALSGNPLDRQLAHAYGHRKDSKTFVPRTMAVTIDVAQNTYVIEGGERIWLKKDSVTTYYVTLESANAQLTIERRSDGQYLIRRQVIGSTHRSPGSSARVGEAWNRAPARRATPSS